MEDKIKKIFATTLASTRLTHEVVKLIKEDEVNFSKNQDEFFKKTDFVKNKIWNTFKMLIQNKDPGFNFKKNCNLSNRISSLVEFNDHLLEQIYKNLDESKTKTLQIKIESKPGNYTDKKMFWNRISENKSFKKSPKPMIASGHIARPQSKYNIKPDNSKNPFVPKIKINDNDDDMNKKSFININPYFDELELLEPLDDYYEPVNDLKFPKDFESVPLEFISNSEQLRDMIEELHKETIIAIDLEHHSYRSYLGMVCLMQISSRNKDYLLDTFKLWDEMPRLIEIFANRKILKVFHGAFRDIEWLQRDFSLYIVNMFDTFCAAEVLNLPVKSLAYLLMLYCKVEAKKEYQLADWRIRPLPQELIDYARSDTHYLIYIYERMKNDIIEKEIRDGLKIEEPQPNSSTLDKSPKPSFLLNLVFQRSRKLCQKVYQKPFYTQEFYTQLLARQNKRFNARQMYVLKEINEWRDSVARKEDESPAYVLANHLMLIIAETLPKNYINLLGCANPTPPLLKENLHQVQSIIENALKRNIFEIQDNNNSSETCNIIQTTIESSSTPSNNSVFDSNMGYNGFHYTSLLSQTSKAPHDYSGLSLFHPQSCDRNEKSIVNNQIQALHPKVSNMFQILQESTNENITDVGDILVKTPFHIFKQSEAIKKKFLAEIETLAKENKRIDNEKKEENERVDKKESNEQSILEHESHLIPLKSQQDPDTFILAQHKKYQKMRPFDKLLHPKPAAVTKQMPSNNSSEIPNKNSDKSDTKGNGHLFDELKQTSFDYENVSYTQIVQDKLRTSNKKSKKNTSGKAATIGEDLNANKKLKVSFKKLNSRTKSLTFKY